MKFKVGDRVRVNCQRSRYHGAVCTVTKELRPVLGRYENGVIELMDGVRVDLPTIRPKAKGVSFPPQYLEPYYDGSERAAWSDCVWQPKCVSC